MAKKNTYTVPLKLEINFNQLKSQKLAMLAWLYEMQKTNKQENSNKMRLLNQLVDMFQEIQDQAVYEQNIPFDTVFADDKYEEKWERESGWVNQGV